MHLKVALSITLIVVMELFLNRSVKNLHLAASKSDKISVPQRLRDEGFYRIKFLTFLKRKIWYNTNLPLFTFKQEAQG
jgi:hypothetical protein